MSDNELWWSVPEVADVLGIVPGAVRELLRERHLVATRRGENNALYVPVAAIDTGDEGPRPLPKLRGTVMLLADAGFSDDEVVEWLMTPHDELGMSPLESLAAGRRAHVRRLAQALF